MSDLDRSAFQSLLRRLDTEKRLDSIIQDFYQKMEADLMVGFFFFGKDLKKIAALQTQFLRRATGLSREYVGRAPADAHVDLAPILPGFFDRRLRILEETLRQNGLKNHEIQTWINFEEAFRNAIVAKP